MTDKKGKIKKQHLFRILSNNLKIVIKAAKLTPDYFISVIVEGIVWGLINSAEAVFTVNLFNALDEGKPFSEIAYIIAVMAVFYLFAYIFDGWYWRYYNQLTRRKLFMRLHEELFDKARTLDVSCYDDPEFYNDFVWAMDEAGTRAFDVLNDIGKIVNRVVASGTLFTLLFSIDTLIACILLASSLLSIIINQLANKIFFEQEKEIKPLRRVSDYVNRVYYLADYAKEIRMSRVSDLMLDKMDDNTDKIVKSSVKFGKKFFVLYGIFDSTLGNIVYFGILLLMFIRLLDGDILVGSFAASVGVTWRVRWLLSDLVERMMKFPKHSLFLEKYFGFLNYKPKTVSGDKPVPEFKSLELDDVSFTYDFSDNPKYEYHESGYEAPKNGFTTHEALRHVSLKLNRGEKIAIVGYNGAGKTTLIKLLMRLYDPSNGKILLNGTDIKEYDLDTYRNKIGTVFQDFKIFASSIAENVMNGNYNPDTDKETVLHALDAAGFTEKLSSLENGVNTTLTREFDDKGTNLSGGEAQKVVIARVFAKPYELIIMDEPSSALDPVAEYRLNEAIMKYASDKTVIFISHRLSTTRMADRIYMFDSGKLSEYGTHSELMEKNGKYAEMFELQSEKYKSV